VIDFSESGRLLVYILCSQLIGYMWLDFIHINYFIFNEW
jgi:hypothetical protein